MIPELSLLEAHQIGWDDFVLNQDQIEELNYQIQKNIADIGNIFTKPLIFNEAVMVNLNLESQD